MNNKEILNYLNTLAEGQKKVLETTDNKTEQLAAMMALYVKRLELLEEFEVAGNKAETFEKLKSVLLESITEMIESL